MTWDAVRALFEREQPTVWVGTGDSITHGLIHTQQQRSQLEHAHEAVRGEAERYHDILVNTAISATRVSDLLERWDHRVARWQPDLVTVMLGTNDCSTGPDRTTLAVTDFADQLREVVARLQSMDALLVLQTPPPVHLPQHPERVRFPDFVEAVRTVAGELDVPLVDHERRWQQLGVPAWGLLNDGIHPNGSGHALLALDLLDALGVRERAPRLSAWLDATVANALPWGITFPGA